MLTAWLGFALFAQTGPANSSTPLAEVPKLSVEAIAITAGPYGQVWEFQLLPDGSVDLRVGYILGTPGKLQGQFGPSKDRVDALRAAIQKQRFMDLPAEISPGMVMAHKPDLRLTITLGDRSHKVRIYSPDQMAKDQEVQRFLMVWKAVFGNVPIRPSW